MYSFKIMLVGLYTFYLFEMVQTYVITPCILRTVKYYIPHSTIIPISFLLNVWPFFYLMIDPCRCIFSCSAFKNGSQGTAAAVHKIYSFVNSPDKMPELDFTVKPRHLSLTGGKCPCIGETLLIQDNLRVDYEVLPLLLLHLFWSFCSE